MKTRLHPNPDSRQRAFGSLLAVVLVLLVCWGQLLSLTACPLQGSTSVAQTSLDGGESGESGDCELSGQLLNLHPYPGDIGLPASLAFLWMLALLTGRVGWGRQYTEPIVFKRRRHLHFCVFRE
ncbi:hypothetical protein [Marinimicrobium alkaliphilum]|uniref:hypothetical protein n=1 Tax=Marinimicrobium alkaliphilum TaxID=2202654 RepID=UPI00130035F8|nr:hypothetical protein [Marinimicrobium alkaliphilum]